MHIDKLRLDVELQPNHLRQHIHVLDDLLLVFHGMYGDRWQLYNLRTEGPCQAILEIAQENQLIVVTPDYRIDQWMGPAGEADTLQILVDLPRQYRINNVFLAGGSMGGTSALTLIRYMTSSIARP